jgi:hypothetical protein
VAVTFRIGTGVVVLGLEVDFDVTLLAVDLTVERGVPAIVVSALAVGPGVSVEDVDASGWLASVDASEVVVWLGAAVPPRFVPQATATRADAIITTTDFVTLRLATHVPPRCAASNRGSQ